MSCRICLSLIACGILFTYANPTASNTQWHFKSRIRSPFPQSYESSQDQKPLKVQLLGLGEGFHFSETELTTQFVVDSLKVSLSWNEKTHIYFKTISLENAFEYKSLLGSFAIEQIKANNNRFKTHWSHSRLQYTQNQYLSTIRIDPKEFQLGLLQKFSPWFFYSEYLNQWESPLSFESSGQFFFALRFYPQHHHWFSASLGFFFPQAVNEYQIQFQIKDFLIGASWLPTFNPAEKLKRTFKVWTSVYF